MGVNPVSVAIVLAVLVLALVAMGVGWRRRARRQRGLVVPPVPAEIGAVRAEAEGMLLATTFAGRPLDRVVAAGLGFRARTRVVVTDRGVLLDRAGGPPLFLPADRLTGSGTATWTLDRVVERDGLVVLAWSLPTDTGAAEAVESSLRLPPGDQAAVLAAVGALTRIPSTPEAPRADPAD